MKRIILAAIGSLLLMQVGLTQPNSATAKTGAGMKLLNPVFFFNTTATPNGRLHKADTSGVITTGTKKEEGFTIKVKANFKAFTGETTLLEIADIVSLKLKQADPVMRDKQNYPAYTMKDGTVPVLEATIQLTAPVEKTFKREMTIGFPIAALAAPWGEHELVLSFTGERWTIYADSQLMDNDFAIGYPQFNHEESWQINPDYVDHASISFPAIAAIRDSSATTNPKPALQYWTPKGHNAWVGDVATIYHQGRYHVFYLYDRRHHGSKMGVGGHYFEHFSTADFNTWTEHEAAVPIEEQWETIGTGTPFVFHDQLMIAYGLHTSRIYPEEMTMSGIQKEFYQQQGKTGAFQFDFSKGYPSGASYSVSQNGIDDFKKSKKLFHYSENPSVYIDPDGKLKMIANFKAQGIWASDHLDSNWRCVNADFPPGGDCTFYFRWGKFDYIIGGFVNLWRKPANAGDEGWVDLVKVGLDYYNGINVPAITKVQDGRFLMAGWFPIRNGWGGPFVIHEMIQFPDGRIRTKWMKEIVPPTIDTVLLAKQIKTETSFPVKDNSFILSFDVQPVKKKAGKLAVSFLSSGKDASRTGCALQLDMPEARAQYSTAKKDSFAVKEASLREDGSPQQAVNYGIEHVTGIDKAFSVRILVKSTAKLGGSIIDTEIAGQNTMITYREDLDIENILFKQEGVIIRNIRLMKVEE